MDKNKGGRPSKYETHIAPKLFLIENWAKDGLIDEEIAKRLDIAVSTLYDYKIRYVEFSEALKRGKEVIDYEVEQSLLKRAMGYEYIETTKEPDIDGVMRVTKEVKKIVIPDTTAMIFWLKNRKPSEWREGSNISVDFGNEAQSFRKYVEAMKNGNNSNSEKV